MIDTRDTLFDAPGPIDRVAREIHTALALEESLTIRRVGSPSDSWLIAEGRSGPYPPILMDTAGLDTETSRGLGWLLELHRRPHPGEKHPAHEARCNAAAIVVMTRSADARQTRCVALSNLQTFLGGTP
jgi:hypothetical protein